MKEGVSIACKKHDRFTTKGRIFTYTFWIISTFSCYKLILKCSKSIQISYAPISSAPWCLNWEKSILGNWRFCPTRFYLALQPEKMGIVRLGYDNNPKAVQALNHHLPGSRGCWPICRMKKRQTKDPYHVYFTCLHILQACNKVGGRGGTCPPTFWRIS